jgi:hypothetical protein
MSGEWGEFLLCCVVMFFFLFGRNFLCSIFMRG